VVQLALLPCAVAFTTGPFRLPTAARHTTSPATCTSSLALRSAQSARLGLRMVAAASATLPSADALKTSQVREI